MADQENPSIPVNFHFSVAEIWNLHGDRPTSGAFGDLVDDFLGKRVEHDRPGSRNKLMLQIRPPVSAYDRVQGREIGQPRSIFALGPNAHLINQSPQLFS